MSRRRTPTGCTLAVVAMVAVAACTSNGNAAAPGTSASRSQHAGTSPVASAPVSVSSTGPSSGQTAGSSRARRVLAAMSERRRVGQLLMVDCPSSGVSSATRSAITRYHVGSVILDGTNTSGMTHDRSVTRSLRALAPSDAGLFVATDQEGGQVQRLQGSGFSRIPSAVAQGRLSTGTLQSKARSWGRQLRAAGVNLNLAPVLDTVPSGFGSNPPIGELDREYGHTPGTVRSHGLAYAAGMTAGGIDVTVKHFPGLGRVHGNTDTTSGVTDTVTTRHDAYLRPFRSAVHAGVPFVMMSTAIYRRIDAKRPAAFSPTIVGGMLRGDLGFRGVIISDDIGAARQVSSYSVGQRAVAFVAAGGDMALTVIASQAATMTAALLHRAKASPSFKKKVDAAALLILQAKQARGLL